MSRTVLVAIIIGVIAAACTPTSADSETTTTPPPTVVTLTTLAPIDTTSSTTEVPETSATTTTLPLPDNDCVVTTTSTVEGYTIGCTLFGIEILAGEDVDPEAVSELADRMYNMLLLQPEYAAAIAEYPIGIRIMATGQSISKLPEFDQIYFHHPGIDWRRLGRSFSGTEIIPYAAFSEENLLCDEKDVYQGEDIFLREFAITMRRYGMGAVDKTTSQAIEQAYGVAIAEGKWKNTLAEINAEQYWAEGVQSFFNANLENNDEEREPISSHNSVNTREELREYDRSLWAIAMSIFGDTEWSPSCLSS